ncbi:MAG TPA: DUF2207 domain-containing protein [Sphingomicrobium sp.]
MRRLWRALTALLLFAAPAAARAEERILHFWSDVQVRKDSSVEVTETIDVRAENDAIRHGIYRDFPTQYRGSHGSRIRIGFTFESATLDGATVQAATEPVRHGVRIKIGDPNTYVAVGDHRYVIRYRATRELGFFSDFDELYWNATGNGWIFPIDVAEARVRFPAAVKLGERRAYTGPQGSRASNAQVVEEKPGEIAWRTTAPLGSYEGLTVAVAFPKGIVAEPSAAEHFLTDFGPILVGAAALAGLLGFFYFAWQRAGRDPRPGTVVPLFSPADNLTPAGMRYVTKMGADNRTFAAALVDMGVRGHIRLVEEDGGWFSKDKTRIERLAGPDPLPSDEEAALRNLVSTGESIMMEQKNHTEFSASKKALEENLKNRYENKLFKRNYGWAIVGVLAFIAAMWVTAAAVVAVTDGAALWRVVVTLGAMAVAGMLALAIHGSSTAGKCLLTFVAFAAFAVALSTGAPILIEALNGGWWLPLAIPALALPFVVTCFWWIAAPTREGRGVLDRIAGFKQYLSVTERDRLDRMTAPEDTPQIFEKYLPYAIALGVENRWADRFQGVLAAAAAAPGGQQAFLWYSGHGDPWTNPSRFADNVGSNLASTISSASTAPGGSSGSGGGGFSGGGGGGGGGGGW